MHGGIDSLLEMTVQSRASDLHLVSDSPPYIRIRQDLNRLTSKPLSAHEVGELLKGMMTPEQHSKFVTAHELDFAYTLPGIGRFRINCFMQKGKPGCVARFIPTAIPSMKELRLPAKTLESLCHLPRGLVLITGPTGCGKTTTIACMIDYINRHFTYNVMTIEDPIEYVHANDKSIVNQREVGVDTSSFSSGLRHVLRQDPDVILIGELRDLESISIGVTAAETGHLVFATLHTNDAASSVDRMIDVFPEHQQRQIRVQVAGSLQAVISQQLVSVAGGRDVAPALEIMIATPAVRNLIRENKAYQIPSIIQSGAKYGMRTMNQSLASLYLEGLISLDEALSRSTDPEDVKSLISRS